MFELALRPIGTLARRRPETLQRVDPDKWSYEPDDGEYYRVLFDCEEGRLISTENYRQRLTKRLIAIQLRRQGATVFLVAAAIVWICYSILHDGNSVSVGAQVTVFFVACVAVIVMFVAGLQWLSAAIDLRSAAYELGPRPVPLPGLEEVERQNIHGIGGFASRDEIDRAARGFTDTSADHQTFDD